MISVSCGELLQDGEHQLLLAHGAGVLDLQLLGKGEKLGGDLGLEVLEFHFPHAGVLGSVRWRERAEKEAVEKNRRSWDGWKSGPMLGRSEHSGTRLDSIRYVQGDTLNIGSARDTARAGRETPQASERLDDHEDDDPDHQGGRYLVEDAVEVGGLAVAVLGEVADQRAQKPWIADMSSTSAAWRAASGALTSRPPRRAQRPSSQVTIIAGVDDAPQQPPLHDLEGLGLLRARLRLAVIDEQPRQIEHARHPGDDSQDMEGLEPSYMVLR